MSPPPIVVIEPVGNDTAPQPKARPPPVHAKTLPNIRRPSISIASAMTVSSPNRPVPSRNTGYLHPFSAFERYFSFNGSKGSVHQRSCPSSPVNRPMTSGRPVGRAPELQLDTRCHDMDYNYIEIAMEVAEETARICDSPLPIPTDVPLVHSGLCFRTADDLNAWLMVRFNYTGHTRSLLDERWTPEFLARDIIRASTMSLDARDLLMLFVTERSPDFGVPSERSGMIPISLGTPCKTPIASVPEEASQLSSPENIVTRSPLCEVPPRRARMKKDLTITLTESPVNTRFPHTPLWSSTSPAPPPPASARRAPKAHSLDHDAGATEPRSGKKAGYVLRRAPRRRRLTACPQVRSRPASNGSPARRVSLPHHPVRHAAEHRRPSRRAARAPRPAAHPVQRVWVRRVVRRPPRDPVQRSALHQPW